MVSLTAIPTVSTSPALYVLLNQPVPEMLKVEKVGAVPSTVRVGPEAAETLPAASITYSL